MSKRTSLPKAAAKASRYQLKITLKWSRPAIWRRVVVPADMTLDRLHDVIQIAMGWTNSHLHEFTADGGRFDGGAFVQPAREFGESDADAADENKHTLVDIAPTAKSKFVYEYDFGDGWRHDVKVEKVLPPDPAFEHPVCLAGGNACPPEDCGGMGGYHQLLGILADPKHPEHEATKEWMGGKFDVAHFDVDRVNASLGRVRRK